MASEGDPITGTGLRSALTWLIHPVSVIALLVMILNDHVLKAAFGTWWTGKLSDVGGLIFFPALVALGLGGAARLARRQVSPAHLAAVAIAVTAVGFTWVKTADAGAATASAVLSAVAGPSIVLRDPTDLFALAALALAWWTARHAQPHLRTGVRHAAAAVILPVAVLASVATTYASEETSETVVGMEDALYVRVAWDVSDGLKTRWIRLDSLQQEPTDVTDTATIADLEAIVETSSPTCLASEPDLCFRPEFGRYGVEKSMDSGKSWAGDLTLTDRQWERITRAQMWPDSLEGGVTTTSVTTMVFAGEEIVVATNGPDGIAVRRADGTWERWSGIGTFGVPHQLDFPTDGVAEPTLLALYIAFGGVLYSCFALLITARGRVSKLAGRDLAYSVPAMVFMAPLLIFAVAGPGLALNTAPEEAASFIAYGTGVMFSAVLIALVFGIPPMMGWRPAVARRQWLREGVLIGFGAAFAVFVLVVVSRQSAVAAWVYEYRMAIGAVPAITTSVVLATRRRRALLREDRASEALASGPNSHVVDVVVGGPA